MENQKIKSFTDLYAWQEGHKLVLIIYSLTDKFPKKEIFGLSNQIRRAAVSITSNIAEGFSRSTNKDKAQFYSVALGSLTEVQNQLIIARDVSCVSKTEFLKVAEKTIAAAKLINGLKRIKNK